MFWKQKPPADEIVGYAIEMLNHLPEGLVNFRVASFGPNRKQLTLEVAPNTRFDLDYPLRYHYSEKNMLWTKDCQFLESPLLLGLNNFGKTWNAAITPHMLPIVLDDVGLYNAKSLELLQEDCYERTGSSDDVAAAFFMEVGSRFATWEGALNRLLDFRTRAELKDWHEMIELLLPLQVTYLDSLAPWLEDYLPDAVLGRLDSLVSRTGQEFGAGES